MYIYLNIGYKKIIYKFKSFYKMLWNSVKKTLFDVLRNNTD